MLLGASTLRAFFVFVYFYPEFVPKTTKYVNNLGKMFLFLFILSRVCSYIWCFGKQTREGVLGFVVGFGGSGNKRGNRITLTRARLPRLFLKNQWRKDLKKFCVSGSVQASITSYGVPFSATTPFRSKTTLSAASCAKCIS